MSQGSWCIYKTINVSTCQLITNLLPTYYQLLPTYYQLITNLLPAYYSITCTGDCISQGLKSLMVLNPAAIPHLKVCDMHLCTHTYTWALAGTGCASSRTPTKSKRVLRKLGFLALRMCTFHYNFMVESLS